MPGNVSLSENEKKVLIDLLVDQAAHAPSIIGAKGYMRNLIMKTNWPPRWKQNRVGGLTGLPEFDARELVDWAVGQEKNPGDPRYTVIAGLLEVLIDDVGLEDQRRIAALIARHGLYLDESLLGKQMTRYQVPQSASMIDEETCDIGPEIDWRGPTEQVELQGWLRPEPDFQDVGFLMRAIKRAASVCRIEIPKKEPQGTGFLIAPTLLLTNYHVLMQRPGEEIQKRARQAVLRFGNITAEDGQEAEGQTFKLAAGNPVLKSSPPDELDYVLLEVEDTIQQSEGIETAPYTLELPFNGMALNILQHPGGEALKLALSGDGVDKVFEEKGIVQYSTRARGGSSGSPCFTDEWKVIALHHAQRSKSFGRIREGIIFKSIYEEIEQYI